MKSAYCMLLKTVYVSSSSPPELGAARARDTESMLGSVEFSGIPKVALAADWIAETVAAVELSDDEK